MSLTPEQIARAISGHDFETAVPYLAEDVSWNIVGGDPLSGTESVLAACRSTAQGLVGVSTRFRRFDVLVGDGFVVVDSLADYVADGETSTVASCDIYRFAGSTLVAITSYNVEIE